ncbi:hypothetical protein IGI37_001131 [Enterococcus sp. AZ194]|uniref:helix-turn-helix transcriptional regulator n=1 Tax=Enterococcus sp. AZ194 TaxID=2774629 RepID=UPI003F24AE87
MNRLFEIIVLLSEKERMTAKELAQHFEVSQRTILRDLDKLLIAGIPIETAKGFNGGISIDKSYRLSTNFMSVGEKDLLVAGLRALDSIHKEMQSEGITKKIFQQDTTLFSYFDIDLSPPHASNAKEIISKIELIKTAINLNKQIAFSYYTIDRQSYKTISPYQLVFRWGFWYVHGFCEKRKEVRLYKLTRIEKLQLIDNPATKIASVPKKAKHFEYEKNFYLVANFDKSQKPRLIDSFGMASFEERENCLHFKQWFDNKNFLISWILGFGSAVEVIEPQVIREEVRKKIQEMKIKYEYDI